MTHDQSEALALSHEIAVMNEGRIEQIGSPREIYERPRNQFVADFVGSTNFLDGTVISRSTPATAAADRQPALGELKVHAVEGVAKNAPVVVSVRPEDVELSRAAAAPRDDGDNVCEGTVDAKVFLGDYLDFQVKVGRCLSCWRRCIRRCGRRPATRSMCA